MAGPPGFFLVIDGPNSVDTSTVAKLVGATLARCGYPVTIARKPSDGPPGVLARTATHEFRGLALACLVAADRYHHLDQVIRAALRAGNVVVCDRYVPSSLVSQRLAGVNPAFTAQLNQYADTPDLTVILTGGPRRSPPRPLG